MDYAYATEEPFKACSSYLHYPLLDTPSHGTCHQGYGREMVLCPSAYRYPNSFKEKVRGNREEWWVVRAGGRRREIPGAILGRWKEKSSPL